MPKTIRIRTDVGQNTSKQLNVNLEQDFDFLEILSLKLLQSDVYIKQCSDYGVIVGRVLVNNGYGIPNAKISVFIPLQEEDEENPIITAIYPYKTIAEVNEDGYRYNLLPYEPSYPGHQATGTFPKREDALIDKTAVQLFDKYYKFTVQTNESGDFMIFGVPIGNQTLVMDVDLSDIGEFSLSPQDLIRIGLATPNQIDGTVFKTSENLNTLPQIINVVRTIEVAPFWGDPETCQIAITRTDFDLGLEADLDIQPAAIFMGSLISTPEEQAQKRKCKVNKSAGNLCSLVSGPGQIKAIRQTIFEDSLGRPSLEPYNFEDDGNVIDENGTWLLDVPMNMDYITTDEFGQRIISNDPKIGIPSSAKYRFKVKWQQQPTLSEPVKRGYFLVPNIREYGWDNPANDPSEDEFPNPSLNGTQHLQFATLQQFGNFTSAPYNIFGLPLIDPNKKAVVKVVSTTNISDYYFTLNGIAIPEKDNIIVDNTDTLTVTITFDDKTQQLIQADMFINLEPYEKFQVEQSYSFSLSWDDYAEPQAAIDCDDTFYEMRYNKVYTVSQIIDQYRKGFSNTKFLSIKDITDDNCQSTSNPFPTNDAQYKTTTLYLLFSFMTLIFKPILFVLLIISHVVAFILKYVMYPLVVVIAVIFLIVILLCNLVKGIASIFNQGDNVNCPDFGDLRDLVQDLLQLWKKMVIRLPNLTYPDCELCECIDEDAQDYADDPYASQSSGLTQNAPSGLMYEFSNIYQYKNIQTETGNYICCPTSDGCNTDNWEDNSEICSDKVLAVQVSLGGSGGPSYSSGGPNVIDSENPTQPKRGWFSTSLPIAERINLFNAKSKFFSGVPGQGYNRIRVSFQPDIKPTSNQLLCHEDNVVIIVVDKNQISQYTPGQLISFQDATLSADINVRNLVTGQTISGSTQINVPFATSSNPNGSNSSRSYVVNITGSTTPQVKFPMDIEYYQVIYTTTLVDMKTDSTPNNDSFFGKVFLQGNYLNRVNYSFAWNLAEFLEMSTATINGKYPYELIEDWQNLGVLVMVRGVDPHTPKVDIQYDISRIFGQPVGNKVIRGNFHLNIPIQSGYKCVRHQQISNNNSTDGIGKNLYFPTYNNLNIEPQKFTGYSTNLHSYYVSLDSTTYSSIPTYIPGHDTEYGYKCGRGIFDAGADGITIFNSTIGTQVNNDNAINDWVDTPNNIGSIYATNGDTPTTLHNETGYLTNEKVEGCSYAHLSFWGLEYTNSGNFPRDYGVQGVYHSRKYPSTTTMNIEHSPQSRYVMRSDRLPTSTYDYPLGDNHMALQQNTGLSIYKISEDGTFASSGSFPGGGGGFNGDSTGDNISGATEPGFVNEVLESFTCGETNSTLVPFGCYEYDATQGTMVVGNTAVCTFKNPGNVEYFKNNCYQMVTKPLISLPVDILTLTEWLSRIKVFFGLCQGVFRHMFTNSWINGTLFAFSFKNDRFFDTRYNRPYNKTCKDTVYFHRPTNNFFYRSSPYKNGDFIGRNSPQPLINFLGLFDYFGGNMKNLMFPTTLMDLGPRDEISKFLSQSASEEYEGYVVNKIPTTTFNEIDEILNLFIISRLGNSNFLQQFFGGGGANILSYFTREKSVNTYYPGPYNYNVKNKNMVDSDYAQLISINSEFGIVPFDIENYPSDPTTTQQETIYFNGDPTAGDAVIGIFFSSYTQNRDFISPKRIVYNQSAPLAANNCNLNPIPIRDQRVPFYQWTIENNNNIFGTQKGHWYTVGIQPPGGIDNFHSVNYQSMDRLISQSRFFRTQNPAQADFYKGYIYSVNNNGAITADTSFTDSATILNGDNVVTAGGPFFFYFGLNRGASAMDRFMTKWVNTDNAVD